MLSSAAMVALDTTPEAALLHEQALRALGNDGRFRIALELSDLTHAFGVAGIRLRHPEWSDEDARRHLAEVLYGSAAATRRGSASFCAASRLHSTRTKFV